MPHRRPKCLRSLIEISTHLNIILFLYTFFLFIYIGIIYWGMSVSDGSPMKHVEVSDGSPIRHIGVRWVSDNNDIFENSLFVGSF